MKNYKFILLGFLFFSFFVCQISAQILHGYVETPMGTSPIYVSGLPHINSTNDNNNDDYIEIDNYILKKSDYQNVSSISFNEYSEGFFIAFNKMGFVNNRNNIIVVEIVGNCSSGSTFTTTKDIYFIGDYIIVDGSSKQIAGLTRYEAYSKN